MSDIVIKVKGLSKRYRLGQYVGGAYHYRTLRDILTDAVYAPFHRLRARSKQRAVSSNPTADIKRPNNPSTDFMWSLKDVSFEVKQGEVVGIIGRNGAGKTTLLKLLSRITEPTQGRVEINGRVGSLLEVGTGFHPELTGRENIYLSGAILGMTKKEIARKFDEIVDFSGVEKFIDTPVKRYSSGMCVRLGFAVAAHMEPEILLIDEVLAVGDAAFQKKCLGKMGDVSKEGRTILFVSHNMMAVENLCQRGVVLDQGQVKFIGGQREAIAQYLKALSANTASLRERKDRRGSGELRVVAIDFRNVNGRRLDVLIPGQDVGVYLHYEVTGDIPKADILAGIIIKTQLGVRVIFHHNRLTRELFTQLPPKGMLICSIKNLLLAPGDYLLEYFVMSNAGYGQDRLDSMNDAVQFTVIENDFYGTGELPISSHGHYLVHANWRVKAD